MRVEIFSPPRELIRRLAMTCMKLGDLKMKAKFYDGLVTLNTFTLGLTSQRGTISNLCTFVVYKSNLDCTSKVCLGQVAHTAGACDVFCSTERLGAFYSPWIGAWSKAITGLTPSFKFALTHLYTWVERGTVRVRCLVQEYSDPSLLRKCPYGSSRNLSTPTFKRRDCVTSHNDVISYVGDERLHDER